MKGGSGEMMCGYVHCVHLGIDVTIERWLWRISGCSFHWYFCFLVCLEIGGKAQSRRRWGVVDYHGWGRIDAETTTRDADSAD